MVALILTPEAYLEIDLALPTETWEYLDEFDEDERDEAAAQLRLAFVAGYASRDGGKELLRALGPLVIKDPCGSTP